MKTPHGKDLLKIGQQYTNIYYYNIRIHTTKFYITGIMCVCHTVYSSVHTHTDISVPVCTRTVTIYCMMYSTLYSVQYLHLFTV